MDHISTRDIVGKINEDTKKLVDKRIAEELRLAKLEEEKLARDKELENVRIAKEEEDKRLEELADIEVSTIAEDIEIPAGVVNFEELPTVPQFITKKYIVNGNDEQIKDLELFLNARNIDWELSY